MDIRKYIACLTSSSAESVCVNASTVLEVSYDEINQFLLSDKQPGISLFTAVKDDVDLCGGTLVVKRFILNKPHNQTVSTDIVSRFWRPDKHDKDTEGIILIILIYAMANGNSMPINYRVYHHSEEKTKNGCNEGKCLQEMIQEVWSQGLRPAWVTANSRYSSLDNLKFLRNLEVGVYMGLEKNRIVSSQSYLYKQVGQVNIPWGELYTHLKGFGFVQVFQTVDQGGDAQHYMIYEPQTDVLRPKLVPESDVDSVSTGAATVCK